MPDAVKDATRELLAAVKAYNAAERRLQQTRDRREIAISTISLLGVSRRTVAKLAGITVGRVQQILDGRVETDQTNVGGS